MSNGHDIAFGYTPLTCARERPVTMNRGLELTDEEVGKIMRKARNDAIEECARIIENADKACFSSAVQRCILIGHLEALKDKK